MTLSYYLILDTGTSKQYYFVIYYCSCLYFVLFDFRSSQSKQEMKINLLLKRRAGLREENLQVEVLAAAAVHLILLVAAAVVVAVAAGLEVVEEDGVAMHLEAVSRNQVLSVIEGVGNELTVEESQGVVKGISVKLWGQTLGIEMLVTGIEQDHIGTVIRLEVQTIQGMTIRLKLADMIEVGHLAEDKNEEVEVEAGL